MTIQKQDEQSRSTLATGSDTSGVTFPKSVRFASELKTAKWLRDEAKKRGYPLTIEQAHEVWATHSDYYCASWLVPDSENPTAEAWRAITMWEKKQS